MSTRIFSSAALALCWLVASGSQPVSAADKKVVPARARAASATLSKEELRQCLAQKESVRVEAEGLDKERTSLVGTKAAIEKRSTEFSNRLAVLDRTSASAVDAYNADVAEREKEVDAFQMQIDAFNVKAASVREHQQTFAQGCGNKLYEEKDENAIRKGK